METWIFGLGEQGLLTEEKVKGIKYNIGRISNDVTKTMLLLANPEIARKVLRIKGLFKGDDDEVKYIQLTKDEDNVVKVSYAIEDQMKGSAAKSFADEASIRAFLEDYCKIGRMRQELTIDYAKKLTDLSGITDLLTDKVIAMGLRGHKITYTPEKGVELFYETPASVAASTPENDAKIIFEDPIHNAQVYCMQFTKRLIDGDNGVIDYLRNYELENGPDERMDALNAELEAELENKEMSIFLHAKNMYKDAVAGIMSRENDGNRYMKIRDERTFSIDEPDYSESDLIFSDVVKRIENMVRLATKDLDPIDRAIKLKACARGRNYDADMAENKLYLQICKEEYLLWLIELGFADIPFIGERLYDESDKGHEFKAGDVIEFIDGEYVDVFKNAYIEVPYNGELTVFSKDNVLYAGMPIAEAIKVPEPEKKISVRLDSSVVIGNAREMFNILNNRQHNRTVIRKETNGFKTQYVMYIRTEDDKKIKIPVFLHNSLESEICGKQGYIVGTRLNTVKNKSGVCIPVIYVDIDYVD